MPDARQDSSARSIRAGDLEAIFLPAHGMLGASLRHKDVEILGRVGDLEAAGAKGSTAGIPFLHPWANRLSEPRYSVLGQEVVLNVSSPLLHLDERGLSMRGAPWSLVRWEVSEAGRDFVVARLDWSDPNLLAIFPFRHSIELTATIRADGLTLETRLATSSTGAVPVSFSFHPYFNLPELPRTGAIENIEQNDVVFHWSDFRHVESTQGRKIEIIASLVATPKFV